MSKPRVQLTERAEEIMTMFIDRRMFPSQAGLIEVALETLLEQTLNEQSNLNIESVDEWLENQQLSVG